MRDRAELIKRAVKAVDNVGPVGSVAPLLEALDDLSKPDVGPSIYGDCASCGQSTHGSTLRRFGSCMRCRF